MSLAVVVARPCNMHFTKHRKSLKVGLRVSVWSYSNLQPPLMKTESAMPILSQDASSTNGASIFKGWSCFCGFQHAKREIIIHCIPYVAFNILGLKKEPHFLNSFVLLDLFWFTLSWVNKLYLSDKFKSVLILELLTCRWNYIVNYEWKMSFQSEKPNRLMKFPQYNTKYECLEQ